MTDQLANLADTGASTTRIYPATVTAITANTITVDPHDGDTVDEVPWYGQTPLVGDEVVLFLSGGLLLAISAGRPT